MRKSLERRNTLPSSLNVQPNHLIGIEQAERVKSKLDLPHHIHAMLAQLFDDHVAVFETNAVLASDRATHLDGQPLDPSDELARLLFLLWRKEDCSVEITCRGTSVRLVASDI